MARSQLECAFPCRLARQEFLLNEGARKKGKKKEEKKKGVTSSLAGKLIKRLLGQLPFACGAAGRQGRG
jgi:RecG-like helicase